MNKLSLFLLAPLSLLFVEANSILVTESTKEEAPFSRNQVIDARDKAIEEREKASNALRDRADDIYNSRISSKDDKPTVIKNIEINQTKEINSSIDLNQTKKINS